MEYNFNEVIDRKNSESKKWSNEYYKEFFNIGEERKDFLPLWVADMDFRTPNPILDSMQEVIKHGIIGYTGISHKTYEAIVDWNKRKKDIDIQEDWIIFTHGVVPALNVAVQSFTNPNDKILLLTPVYPQFNFAIINNEREAIYSALININGYYTIDFDDVENKIISNNVKMIIFCSPHNPIGRVWKKDEILKLGEICKEHNVFIVSDEIHSDLIYKDNKFYSFLRFKDFYDKLIVCTAPTKTFNLAGVQTAINIIPNEKIRDKFKWTLEKSHFNVPNIFTNCAITSAYTKCDKWLDSVIDYLDENRKFIKNYIDENMSKIKYHIPEGTYLGWLDFSEILDPKNFENFFEKECCIGFTYGKNFVKDGDNFIRINFACSREILRECLDRIKVSLNR